MFIIYKPFYTLEYILFVFVEQISEQPKNFPNKENIKQYQQITFPFSYHFFLGHEEKQ